MTIFRPFQAIRPKKELASSIASLPYDVYTRSEAYKSAARSPSS